MDWREKMHWCIIMALAGILIALLSNIGADKAPANNSKLLEKIEHKEVKSEAVDKNNKLSEDEQKLIDEYNNLGIVVCSGYVNLRKSPNKSNNLNITASIEDKTPCDVLSSYESLTDSSLWYQVKFGDVTGYIEKKYIVTGFKAKELFKDTIISNVVLKEYMEEYIVPYKWQEVGVLEQGSKLSLQCYDKDWYKILETGTFIHNYESAWKVESKNVKKPKIAIIKESFINEYERFAVVKTDSFIDIKEEPRTDSKSVGVILNDTSVDILEEVAGERENETWYHISSGKASGYIRSSGVITGDEAVEYGLSKARLMAIIGDEEQEVYKDGNRLSGVWTRLAKNRVYRVLNTDGYWVEIELDSGDSSENGEDRAFINVENSNNVKVKYSMNIAIPYLEMMSNTDGPVINEYTQSNMELRQRIVEYACQFIGNPYVWGGTDLVNGADCSGFVQSVLKHFNVHVPRVSYDQATVGKPLEANELKPGDLVFYANSSGTVNHVAMYIGNGMIVNAGSSKSGILLNTWNYRTPVAMRDVIGNRER